MSRNDLRLAYIADAVVKLFAPEEMSKFDYIFSKFCVEPAAMRTVYVKSRGERQVYIEERAIDAFITCAVRLFNSTKPSGTRSRATFINSTVLSRWKSYTASGNLRLSNEETLYPDYTQIDGVVAPVDLADRPSMDTRYVIMPLNLDNVHWQLAILDLTKHTAYLYDSMNGAYSGIAGEWIDTINNFYLLALSGWVGILNPERIVPRLCTVIEQQKDGHNCGAFVCWYIYLFIRGYPLQKEEMIQDGSRWKIIPPISLNPQSTTTGMTHYFRPALYNFFVAMNNVHVELNHGRRLAQDDRR